MTHTIFKQWLAKCVSFVTIASMILPTILPATATAAPLNLPTKPLTAVDGAKPNFMYILDNSGSMAHDAPYDNLSNYSTFYNMNPIIVWEGDSYRCKIGLNKNGPNTGVGITHLKRTGTTLEVTTSGSLYYPTWTETVNIGGFTHFTLRIPGIKTTGLAPTSDITQEVFSGKYLISPKVDCAATNVPTVFSPYCSGASNGGDGNPACSCSGAVPANSGSTSEIWYGASTDACRWHDPVDSTTSACTAVYADPLDKFRFNVQVIDAGPSGDIDMTGINASVTWYEGSMCAQGEPPRLTSEINSMFYNPKLTYTPPPLPGSNTTPPATLQPMTSANTSGWTQSKIDGFAELNAAGVAASATIVGTNLVNLNNAREAVFCDSAILTTAEINDTSASAHCRANTGSGNTTNNYPYQYPQIRDGAVSSAASLYSNYEMYQEAAGFTGKNPVMGNYNFSQSRNTNPHYYTITPIEHCTDASLKTCQLGGPSGIYQTPAYVRYCDGIDKASEPTLSPAPNTCQAKYSTNPFFTIARYGIFTRKDIKFGSPGYTKLTASERADCAASTCTYNEEMTNYANWYAYYRTRMALMKSASANAFSTLDENLRIGFITINDPQGVTAESLTTSGTLANAPGKYLQTSDFDAAQKSNWLSKLYSPKAPVMNSTPLRQSLSQVGRIFAGKAAAVGLPAGDPVQYACQKNFSLLTTDGAWNLNPGKTIDGSADIGDMDAGAAPPKKDLGAQSGTLADVAFYYRNTNLRDASYANCISPLTGENLCSATYPQNMKTFTLGLGVDGALNYTDNYATPIVAGSDYHKLTQDTLYWPWPVDPLGKIDDLWHAAVNGDGTYFSAKSPQALTDALVSSINSISAEPASGSPPAVTSMEPTATDFGYSTSYVNKLWVGNLVARSLSTNVNEFYNPGAAVAWCADTASPLDTSIGACVGSLSSRVLATTDTRTIWMASSTGATKLKNFEYANFSNTQQQYFKKAYLGTRLSQWPSLTSTSGGQQDLAEKANLVNYIRGQKGYENSAANPMTNRLYRVRQGVLGDITDSDPAFAGKPVFSYTDAGYAAFKSGVGTTRGKTVYVGANDGMLHAFNAETGNERWAFVPTALFPKLHKLADKSYGTNHANYMNGDPAIGDVYYGGAWHTILVSGYGEGARGLFAMDITDPDAPILLWETQDTNSSDELGYIYGKPVITKVGGSWVVLTTTGYNNANDSTNPFNQDLGGDGKGRLIGLNPVTGAITINIATGVGTSANPANMAPLSALATHPNKDNTSKYAYAGDLSGNLWAFNLESETKSKLATLNATGNQPITVAPMLAKINGDVDVLVIVGTGKALENSDVGTTTQQTLYAIKDTHSGVTHTPRSNIGAGGFIKQTFSGTAAQLRTITNNPVDLSTDKGWFIDLDDAGERQISMGNIVAGLLVIPTVTLNGDSCAPSGRGWMNYFDFATGSAIDGTTTSTVGTYSDKPITGAVTLVKTDASGNKVIGTYGSDSDGSVNFGGASTPSGGSGFTGTRLNWHELIEE